MKKRTILFIFSILIILIGLLIFSEKIGFIKSIENIKNKKIEEIEITKIDVTDLENNGNLNHEHLFKTMYDENEHWNECMVCGKKENVVEHKFETKWKLGYESCEYTNGYIKECTCGYSISGHKPCVWKGKWIDHSGFCNDLNGYIEILDYAPIHSRCCSVCGMWIMYSYYEESYGNGLIHNLTRGSNGTYAERCRNKEGKLISCSETLNNGGACAKCDRVHVKGNHVHVVCNSKTGNVKCFYCDKVFGKFTNIINRDNNSPATYTVKTSFVLENCPIQSYELRGFKEYNGSYIEPSAHKQEVLDGSVEEYIENGKTITKFTIITTGKLKEGIKSKIGLESSFWLNGVEVLTEMIPMIPDLVQPTISNINSNSELTEWSRSKPIKITGTENYCNLVNVKILDDKENIIFEGKTSVNNKNYSISCVPQLEAGLSGRKFKVIVTDTCENSTQQDFTISKIDSFGPVATSANSVTGEWSKSRKFTFKATDIGAGEVSIAFNDIEDLELARFNEGEYSRDYEFYGDVYSPKQLSVLYRDKLGNTSIQKVTIDKLDNTAPTITNASIHNNVVSVVANDVHEDLGEGSGVVKYRYIASDEKLDSPDVSAGKEINASENIIIDEIYKFKYVYIEAEDLVGNVSEVYEFKIPELVLTSRVDTSLADGKGGVILDWSTYDVEDKYFVIYRKEENATKWETIVSLEEKLTGSGYTDILANDKSKPNISNINIRGDAENNNIKINATSNNNGSNYSYYIEAYDSNNMETLLNFSNII